VSVAWWAGRAAGDARSVAWAAAKKNADITDQFFLLPRNSNLKIGAKLKR